MSISTFLSKTVGDLINYREETAIESVEMFIHCGGVVKPGEY